MLLFVDVQSERTHDAKVGKLLDLLERCGPNAFDGLIQALENTGQSHVAATLNDALNSRGTNSNILFQMSVFLGIVYNSRLCDVKTTGGLR